MIRSADNGDDIRLRRELSEMQGDLQKATKRIQQLEDSAVEAASQTATPGAGDNVLRNGEAEFSDDAYNDLGLGGDAAERIAFWSSHLSTDTLLAFTSSELLKASTHSAYAADDPDWEKTTGRIRLGTTRTISQQLPNRYAQQGSILYFQFTATLRTATALPAGLKFFAEIYDNTAGQEKIISGATLALTIAVQGTPGATTRQYRVIVTTDKGDTYQVDAAAIVNAPNSQSVVNYVRVSWTAIPGRVSARVEKLQGGVYALLTEIASGTTEYNDYGDAGTVIGAFSTGTFTAIRARIDDSSFAPAFGVINRYAYAIKIPEDYNISLTTGDQLLRIGLSAALTDARQLILDRFQLGFTWGGFQRSAADIAIVNPLSLTANPYGGLLPPATSDPYDAPDTGSGGPRREYTIA